MALNKSAYFLPPLSIDKIKSLAPKSLALLPMSLALPRPMTTKIPKFPEITEIREFCLFVGSFPDMKE